MKKLLKVTGFLFLLLSLSLLGSNIIASDVPTLLSPNGGEAIQSGIPYTILWEAPPEAVKFDLTYSIDDGLTWELIENNITGTSYDWNVPVLTENRNDCRMKITGYDSLDKITGDDVSSMAFTIETGE